MKRHGITANMPKLTLVTDAAGKITGVKISYPLDLTAQTLEYSALTQATREMSRKR